MFRQYCYEGNREKNAGLRSAGGDDKIGKHITYVLEFIGRQKADKERIDFGFRQSGYFGDKRRFIDHA